MTKRDKPKPSPKPKGRPEKYTEAIASEICERLADGETLPDICSDKHLPARSTVIKWVIEDRHGFSDRYRAARELQRDAWADDMVTIADDGRNDWMERHGRDSVSYAIDKEVVARSALRINTRQWLMKVGAPAKYGDKVEQTHKADEAFLALWREMHAKT